MLFLRINAKVLFVLRKMLACKSSGSVRGELQKLQSPLLLSPFLADATSEARMGFVLLLMAVLWVTDATSLPVTPRH